MTQEIPILRGEALYIPFVGAIIERKKGNRKEILVQTRAKSGDSFYSGALEIPGGKMRAFEDVYDTVRREAKEECGLDVTFIQGEERKIDCSNRGAISTWLEPFCVTQMKNGPFVGLIFLCRAEGEPVLATEESKDAKWIDIEELSQIVQEEPEKIYTPFLAPLKKYLNLI